LPDELPGAAAGGGAAQFIHGIEARAGCRGRATERVSG
jgi:hypothetical protein